MKLDDDPLRQWVDALNRLALFLQLSAEILAPYHAVEPAAYGVRLAGLSIQLVAVSLTR